MVQGQKISESLRALIAPYFLRREKSVVLAQRTAHLQALAAVGQPPLIQQSSSAAEQQPQAASEHSSQPQSEAPQHKVVEESKEIQKNDLIVWMRLSDAQVQLYRAFVSSEEVKVVLNSTKSPLAALTVLKKVSPNQSNSQSFFLLISFVFFGFFIT